MKLITSLFLLALLGLTPSVYAKPDFEIHIGTLHGQLRYTPEAFAVKPGSTIRLNFKNSDEMIHNFILAKGDGKTIDKLAESALKLGEKGMEMGFVPKDPSILASIGLVQPGKNASVEFTAPKEKGDFPYVCTFPGHSLTMRGIMKVVDDPNAVDFATPQSDRRGAPQPRPLIIRAALRLRTLEAEEETRAYQYSSRVS